MKKKPLMQTVTKLVWGMPVIARVPVSGQFSEEFGDFIDIDLKDELTVVKHLFDRDSVAYALDTLNLNHSALSSRSSL